jgi:hypothetical protein
VPTLENTERRDLRTSQTKTARIRPRGKKNEPKGYGIPPLYGEVGTVSNNYLYPLGEGGFSFVSILHGDGQIR